MSNISRWPQEHHELLTPVHRALHDTVNADVLDSMIRQVHLPCDNATDSSAGDTYEIIYDVIYVTAMRLRTAAWSKHINEQMRAYPTGDTLGVVLGARARNRTHSQNH